MTARFLLNLRKVDAETAVGGGSEEQELSKLEFRHSSHSRSFMSGFGEDPILSVRHECEVSVLCTGSSTYLIFIKTK